MARIWHFLGHSLIATVMHLWWLWLGGALVSGAAALGADGSLLQGLGIGFTFCFTMLAIAASLRWRVTWKEKHPEGLRRWRELRRYTNAGLTWMMVGKEVVDGHGVATLRISPTASDLPVPLKLEIACLGKIDGIFSGKVFPDEIDQYADLHIYPVDNNKAYVTLVSPRLHPPVYLEIKIRPAGDDVRVRDVRRNPR